MPSLTYTLNIPNPPNSPSVDVPNMQTNTNSINTIWTEDHFTFSDANPGLHKQVQISSALGTIPPGLQGGFETLYAKAVAGNGELFFTRGNTGIEIQMTGPGAPSPVANGYTFLPGGILIQWGTTAGNVSNGATINFNTPFPNACFVAIPSIVSSTTTNLRSTYSASSSPSSFVVTIITVNGPSNATISWIAIGN